MTAPADTAECASAADVLDFLTSTVDSTLLMKETLDIIAALPASVEHPATESDILEIITRAYSESGFYQSGTTTAMEIDRMVINSAIRPPVSGLIYHCDNWKCITSHFGWRDRFNRMHLGVDIAMCTGDTVVSAMPGVVRKTGYDRGGYGHYVIIAHDNGMETCYAHLSARLVDEAARIEDRQPIALSGSTGHSTGPHLHFEVRYRGVPVDPLAVFDLGL